MFSPHEAGWPAGRPRGQHRLKRVWFTKPFGVRVGWQKKTEVLVSEHIPWTLQPVSDMVAFDLKVATVVTCEVGCWYKVQNKAY